MGCAKQRPVKLPPVTEGWRQAKAAKSVYIVQEKDSLYSIAWAFGLDYRYLATINNLHSPYKIYRGQHLRIATVTSKLLHKGHSIAKRGKQITSETNLPSESSKLDRGDLDIAPLKGWCWPTLGRVKAIFSSKLGGNKGVDIGGSYGQAILASNQGVVVYSGTGIRSYGKLIIIKHDDDYLSAYAYNKYVFVEEGKEVKAGQKIATMGRDDAGRACLHFEIRRFGQPVNPLRYLPQRKY